MGTVDFIALTFAVLFLLKAFDFEFLLSFLYFSGSCFLLLTLNLSCHEEEARYPLPCYLSLDQASTSLFDFSVINIYNLHWQFWHQDHKGASSGIGAETTRVLALCGAHVIMGVRNMVAAKDVKDTILKDIPSAKVDAIELDLSSLDSVKKFAFEFNSLGCPLNILINNAGIMAFPFKLSKDNIELQVHIS